MRFFKQLFCRHIDVEYSKTPLTTKITTVGDCYWYQTIKSDTYASYIKCLKCNRKGIKLVTVEVEIDKG